MEFKTNMQTITTTVSLLDTAEEKPVDMDVVLPDYCPDVAAILCCELIPYVTSDGWSGDTLVAEGTALVRVLYLDEDRRVVHTYEVSQAFSASFLTEGRRGEVCSEVTATTEYVHCRAVSPRRLDIHGALCVRAEVTTAFDQTAIADTAQENVYVKTEALAASVPAGCAKKPFSVNETLGSADGVSCVLRSHAVPCVTETKVLAGKIIVKGDLHVENLVLCDADSGKTEENRFTLPFSQMLDLAGVDETTAVDARVWVTAHHVRIEEDGGAKILYSNTKLMLSAQAWKTSEASVVTDAYATAMPVMTETVSLESRRLSEVLRDTATVSKTLDLPQGVSEILSVWCEAQPLEIQNAESGRLLSGRLSVHLLAKDGEGQVQYFERTADFSQPISAVGSSEKDGMQVVSTEVFSETEGQMTVKATICLCRRVFEEAHVTAVCGITGDEDAAYPACDAAVKIVYADEGESLWNVAKAAHTSVEALKIENELEADILEKRTMLLVPLT